MDRINPFSYNQYYQEAHHQTSQAEAGEASSSVPASAPAQGRPVEARFLAALAPYSEGQSLSECERRSGCQMDKFFTLEGGLTPTGEELNGSLPPDHQLDVLNAIGKRQMVMAQWEGGATAWQHGPQRAPDTMDGINPFSYNQYYQEAHHQTSQAEAGEASSSVPAKGRPVEARFLAAMAAYGRGEPRAKCATDLKLSNYVTDDGHLLDKGEAVYDKKLSPEGRRQVDDALKRRRQIHSGKAPAQRRPVGPRFLAAMAAYGRGEQLAKCATDLQLSKYVTDDGHLRDMGEDVNKKLPPAYQEQVRNALDSRKAIYATKVPVAERFLAAMAAYGRGERLVACATDLQLDAYVTDDGHLHDRGEQVFDNLPPAYQEQVRNALDRRKAIYNKRKQVKDALESRQNIHSEKANRRKVRRTEHRDRPGQDPVRLPPAGSDQPMAQREAHHQTSQAEAGEASSSVPASAPAKRRPVEPRFLAAMAAYGRGERLVACATDLQLSIYVTDDGRLSDKGEGVIKNLPPAGQQQVRDAIKSRQKIRLTVAERFLAAMEAYGRGEPLVACATDLQLSRYVTDDGRRRDMGEDVIKNLPPAYQEQVRKALDSRKAIYDKRLKQVDDALESRRQIHSEKANRWKARRTEHRDRPGQDPVRLPPAGSDRPMAQREGGATAWQHGPQRAPDTMDRINPFNYNQYYQEAHHQTSLAEAGEASSSVPASAPAQGRPVEARFLAALAPYSEGQSLGECERRSGCQMDKFFTLEGGLTPTGEELNGSLPPDHQLDVLNAIGKRQMVMTQREGGATAGQLTGHAAVGDWGMPPAPVVRPMPHFGMEAVGEGWQHGPQRAPDRLGDRLWQQGVMDDDRINILGQQYVVRQDPYQFSSLGSPVYILYPHLQGG